MKTVVVPYIENLETLSGEKLNEIMEIKAVRQAIDHAPWNDYSYKPITSFDIAASRSYLFVRFFVRGLGLKAECGHTNEPVWQDSCVEIFICDADGKRYHNFELNCIGTILSAAQRGRGIDVEPISEDDACRIIRYTSINSAPFHEIPGVHQWQVIVGIPFNLVGFMNRPSELRANFYKCADASRWPHYLCWAPIDTPEPDFHRPEFFGRLIFE